MLLLTVATVAVVFQPVLESSRSVVRIPDRRAIQQITIFRPRARAAPPGLRRSEAPGRATAASPVRLGGGGGSAARIGWKWPSEGPHVAWKIWMQHLWKEDNHSLLREKNFKDIQSLQTFGDGGKARPDLRKTTTGLPDSEHEDHGSSTSSAGSWL